MKKRQQNLNACKPSELPPSGGKLSNLGENIGCRDKNSSRYREGFPIVDTSGQQYNIGEKPTVTLSVHLHYSP